MKVRDFKFVDDKASIQACTFYVLLEVLLLQKIVLFTTGLQVTSWQPCWWSKTKTFLSSGN